MLLIVLYFGLIGLFFGSFFNVLVDRLPAGESILFGRSHCDFCKKNLRWFELIPVLSFLLQRGKCRRCHHSLSIRYPISELLTAVLFMGTASLVVTHSFPIIAVTFLLVSILWVIFWTDILTYMIPDSLIVIGCVVSLFFLFSTPPLSIAGYLLSASVGSGFFYFLWFVTKGKGMGFGDVKLVLLLGLALGFPRIVTALYVAFLTGAIVGIILIIGGKKHLKSKIPFGPFLIIGAALSCFIPPITTWLFML